jgi:hypothetical protein
VTPIEQYCHSSSATLPWRRTDLKEGKNRPLVERHKEMTMKKASLLAVLVVLFIVVGWSNHTQQVIPRAAAPASTELTSFFTSAPASQTVSDAPGEEVAAPVRELSERAKPDPLPAIVAALDYDKKEFCQYSQSANCEKDFIQAFHFRKVTLSKSGQVGFIVEFSGEGFCGSAGCAINVLKQTGGKFEKTFEIDEVGSLDSFEFAKTITNGFYDLTKHGGDGTDYNYSWTGSNYEDVESPVSAGQTRTVAGASEASLKECKDCLTAKPVGVPFSQDPATIR